MEVFIIFTEEDIVIYPSNHQSSILYKIDAKTSIISSIEYEIASENQSIPLVVSAQSLAQALQKESEIKIQFRLSAIKPQNNDEPQLPFLKILHKSFDQVVTVEHNIFVKFFEEKISHSLMILKILIKRQVFLHSRVYAYGLNKYLMYRQEWLLERQMENFSLRFQINQPTSAHTLKHTK
jgi:hypothetical protein